MNKTLKFASILIAVFAAVFLLGFVNKVSAASSGTFKMYAGGASGMLVNCNDFAQEVLSAVNVGYIGDVYTCGTGIIFGDYSRFSTFKLHNGIRFTAESNAPTGMAWKSEILSARLKMWTRTIDPKLEGIFSGTWYGHKTSWSQTFVPCSYECFNVTSRVRTTTSVSADSNQFPTDTSGYQYVNVELAPIIQEIVNQNQFPGRSFTLIYILNGSASDRFREFWASEAKQPILEVTYSYN